MKYVSIEGLENEIYVFDDTDNLCKICSYPRDEGSVQCLSCNIFNKHSGIPLGKKSFKKNVSCSWYVHKKGAEKPSKRSPHIMTWLILKSKNDEKFIPFCAELLKNKMIEFINKFPNFSKDVVLCVVPDYDTKKTKKANTLGEEVSKKINLPYVPLLKKIKETEKQHKFSKGQIHQKFENVKGAFGFNKECSLDMEDKVVFLIDDVVSSMATVNECAKVLKDNGFSEVFVFSLGRNLLIPPKEDNEK